MQAKQDKSPQEELLRLAADIRSHGFDAGPYHPETILCSPKESHLLPSCFQVGLFTSLRGKSDWYLRTWPPLLYRVADGGDVLEVCLSVLRIGNYGGSRLPAAIINQFDLQELTAAEFQDEFGFH